MGWNINDDDNELEEVDFEFELLNSDDMMTVTLVCRTDRPLEPAEFAEALRIYAERIDCIVSMTEVSSGPLN